MINLLKGIVNAISSLFDFFINAIKSFVNLLLAIPKFTGYIFQLVNNLIPDIFKPFIIISIIVAIILLILGRNN